MNMGKLNVNCMQILFNQASIKLCMSIKVKDFNQFCGLKFMHLFHIFSLIYHDSMSILKQVKAEGILQSVKQWISTCTIKCD